MQAFKKLRTSGLALPQWQVQATLEKTQLKDFASHAAMLFQSREMSLVICATRKTQARMNRCFCRRWSPDLICCCAKNLRTWIGGKHSLQLVFANTVCNGTKVQSQPIRNHLTVAHKVKNDCNREFSKDVTDTKTQEAQRVRKVANRFNQLNANAVIRTDVVSQVFVGRRSGKCEQSFTKYAINRTTKAMCH